MADPNGFVPPQFADLQHEQDDDDQHNNDLINLQINVYDNE